MRKKNNGGDVLEGSRNDDRKIMQSIKAMNRLPTNRRKRNHFFYCGKVKNS